MIVNLKAPEYNKFHIYESMDQGIAAIVGDACVIVMEDFNGHVGFLGEQEKNYGGEMLLEFAERWGLVILNCDSRCISVYNRSVRNEKSVIDYIMVNECTYRYFWLMEIDEDKVLYDLSDHAYVFMGLIVREDKPRYRGVKLEEVKYFKIMDGQLMKEYIGELERRVRIERRGSVGVGAYDDMIGSSSHPRRSLLRKTSHSSFIELTSRNTSGATVRAHLGRC